MKIFGEEYGFLMTVGASTKIADLCPDGDLTRMGEMMEGKTSEMMKFSIKLILAMSEAYDASERFWGREVTHKPLSEEMLNALPLMELKKIQTEAVKAFKDGMETTVEVAPPKKEENPSKGQEST